MVSPPWSPRADSSEASTSLGLLLDEPYQAEVRVAFEKMGFDPAKVVLTDVVLGTPVDPNGGVLSLEILGNRWRYVSIKPGG